MTKTTKKSTEPTGPDYIERSLWSLCVPIDEVFEDPSNARQHSERNLELIASSLKKYKQQKPLVVDLDGVVLAGNGTLAAARKLGWKHIAVQRSASLSASRTAASGFSIVDNRASDTSGFDEEALSQALQALQADGEALADLGWTDQEFSDLLKNLEGPAAPNEFEEFDESIPTEFRCPSCGYKWSGSTS